jgi:hypothetical protein
MTQKKLSDLELATEVFDGWSYVSVKAPEGYVAVKGDSEVDVPLDSYYWFDEQGITPGWAKEYLPNETIIGKMFPDIVYAIPIRELNLNPSKT